MLKRSLMIKLKYTVVITLWFLIFIHTYIKYTAYVI